ncbi:MAG TPA: EAL domain-containing protein [Acidimicrobiales bacterium]|nr:EAL domain-containing protein [Acidimicrobiales bacterium]
MQNIARRAVITVLVVAAVVPTVFPGAVSPLVIAGLVGTLSLAALVAGVTMNRLGSRLAWHVGRPAAWALLGGGLAGLVISDLLRDTAGVSHIGQFPSIAELPLVLAYPCMAAGLLILLESRSPGEAVESGLSSFLAALVVALPVWAFVLAPLAADGRMPTAAGVVGLMLPAADLLLLLLAIRLVRITAQSMSAYSVLMLSFACLEAAHCIALVGLAKGVGWSVAGLQGPLLLGYGLWGVAALHPSMGDLFEPAPRVPPAVGWLRLGALSAAAMLGPVVLAVQSVRRVPLGMPGFAVIVACLPGVVVVLLVRMVRERTALEHQARHDDLTGLPRRDLFDDRLAIAMAAAHQRGKGLAVLFIDLDRFKKVNDSLGHAAGNQLLQLVAKRLVHCVRDCDTVARMGGDEFTILMPEFETEADAVGVARKVLAVFREPFQLGKRQLYVTGSVGVAVYPRDGETTEAMMKNADAAMYAAKEKGRDTYHLYTPVLNAMAHEKLDLESSLHQAIERGELVLHYQPKVTVQTGRVEGVEALVRWRHPELGLLGPDRFIPLAEETGLIVPLGEWVLETACAQANEWVNAGYPPIQMAVNLSARQFQLQAIPEMVASVLRRTGLDPTLLELELTESLALQGDDHTREALEQLVAMGVRCAVDDFGVGFSNFGYLDTLPIHEIKIDKTFVAKIGEDSEQPALVVGIIALGRGLGLKVVAEGVENRRQLDVLRALDCDTIQGFFFSKPLPADELATLLMLEVVSPGQGRLTDIGPVAAPRRRKTDVQRREPRREPLRAAEGQRRVRPLRAG